MRILSWQTILMKYHSLFFLKKIGKMLQNLSSAAVVIGALSVNHWSRVEETLDCPFSKMVQNIVSCEKTKDIGVCCYAANHFPAIPDVAFFENIAELDLVAYEKAYNQDQHCFPLNQHPWNWHASG